MEENNVPKKTKSKKNIVIVIALIVLLIFVYLLGAGVFRTKGKVVNSIFEDRSQLVSQVQRITIVKYTAEDKTISSNIPLIGSSRVIFSYDVVIEAGIDASKVKYVSESKKEKTLTIEIPHSEIYSATVDYDSKKVYLDQNHLFSNTSFEEGQDAVKELVGEAKERAKNEGKLLDYADQNAKKIIEDVIKTNKLYKDYTINYQYVGENL